MNLSKLGRIFGVLVVLSASACSSAPIGQTPEEAARLAAQREAEEAAAAEMLEYRSQERAMQKIVVFCGVRLPKKTGENAKMCADVPFEVLRMDGNQELFVARIYPDSRGSFAVEAEKGVKYKIQPRYPKQHEGRWVADQKPAGLLNAGMTVKFTLLKL